MESGEQEKPRLGSVAILVLDDKTSCMLEGATVLLDAQGKKTSKTTDSRGIAFFYGVGIGMASAIIEAPQYEKNNVSFKVMPLPISTDVKVRLRSIGSKSN